MRHFRTGKSDRIGWFGQLDTFQGDLAPLSVRPQSVLEIEILFSTMIRILKKYFYSIDVSIKVSPETLLINGRDFLIQFISGRIRAPKECVWHFHKYLDNACPVELCVWRFHKQLQNT